jgi:hypothetical protein
VVEVVDSNDVHGFSRRRGCSARHCQHSETYPKTAVFSLESR